MSSRFDPMPMRKAAEHCAELAVAVMEAKATQNPDPARTAALHREFGEARRALVERCMEEQAAITGVEMSDVRSTPRHAMQAAFNAGAMYDLALHGRVDHAPPPLTQYDLKDRRCNDPGCQCEQEGIVLHARCHMGAPSWAHYDPEFGMLTLRCAECDKAFTQLAVARGGEHAAEPWLTE
jgi:hypothetical protein